MNANDVIDALVLNTRKAMEEQKSDIDTDALDAALREAWITSPLPHAIRLGAFTTGPITGRFREAVRCFHTCA